MGINKLFTGYAVIEIFGENIEGFTNAALKEDIAIGNLRPSSTGCKGTVPIGSLRKLRYLAHQNGVYFTIKGIGGLPKAYRTLKAYRVPAGVICATLIFLICYCQSILFVQIQAGDEVDSQERQEILSMAESYGVTPGLWRRDIDWNAAAHSIMSQYPDLSWVGFDRSGVIITVRVVSKDVEDEKAHLLGDVIAKKDGVVKSLLVLEGQGRVEAETPVKKGDVLISGEIYYTDAEGNSLGEPSQVHAKGLVEASVWYTAEAVVSLKEVEAEATGKKTGSVIMNWQGQDYLIWGSGEHDYEDWREEVKTKKISQSLSFTTVTQLEMKPKILNLSPEEAEAKAKKQAYAQVLKKIPTKAQVVNKGEEILAQESPDTVKIRVTVETRENIGRFQSFTGNF